MECNQRSTLLKCVFFTLQSFFFLSLFLERCERFGATALVPEKGSRERSYISRAVTSVTGS